MDIKLLVCAIIAMVLALSFYSIGVWGEKLSGTLKKKNIVFFALGLLCDSTGTSIMRHLVNRTYVNPFEDLHMITGTLALLVMIFHLAWAIYVYLRGSQSAKENFHKFSIIVWIFWLIPFIIGMIIGMRG